MWFLFVAWQVLARIWLTTMSWKSHLSDSQRFVSLTAYSQASSPRSVTSPQLPSPRTNLCYELFIWYDDSLQKKPELRNCPDITSRYQIESGIAV